MACGETEDAVQAMRWKRQRHLNHLIPREVAR
jgi:alpha/beta superfamily hydrolase